MSDNLKIGVKINECKIFWGPGHENVRGNLSVLSWVKEKNSTYRGISILVVGDSCMSYSKSLCGISTAIVKVFLGMQMNKKCLGKIRT